MDTAEISYRVADFLKKHPPFHSIDEADLVALAARGRVRFYEANDFVLWQGEPHRAHVFVIQQGKVCLWNEANGRAELRDILGAGDTLGVERFNGAPCCAHSARAESDVVLYTFPAEDFAGLLERYPHAAQYVAAQSGVAAEFQPAGARREPQELFLHDLVRHKTLHTCTDHDSVREVARRLIAGADAIGVVDGDGRARAIVTPQDILAWIAKGGGDVDDPIARSPAPRLSSSLCLGYRRRVGDRDLQWRRARNHVRWHGRRPSAGHCDRAGCRAGFGDQPVSILREASLSQNFDDLRALNLRARAFVPASYSARRRSTGWRDSRTRWT